MRVASDNACPNRHKAAVEVEICTIRTVQHILYSGDTEPLATCRRLKHADEGLRRRLGARAGEQARMLTWARGARAALDALDAAAA